MAIEGVYRKLSERRYYLKEENLLYGEMPKKRNEVVIDRQLLKNMEAQNGPVTSLHGGKRIETVLCGTGAKWKY